MSALDDLREHPVPAKPWRLRDPDALSFHEVVCDLARQALLHPEEAKGLPDEVAHELGRLNETVITIARVLRDMAEKI